MAEQKKPNLNDGFTNQELKWIIPGFALVIFAAYWFFMGLGYVFKDYNTGADHSNEVQSQDLEWKTR